MAWKRKAPWTRGATGGNPTSMPLKVLYAKGGGADILTRALDGEKISAGAGCKKLKPLNRRTAILIFIQCSFFEA
jgi:hypothetical protein